MEGLAHRTLGRHVDINPFFSPAFSLNDTFIIFVIKASCFGFVRTISNSADRKTCAEEIHIATRAFYVYNIRMELWSLVPAKKLQAFLHQPDHTAKYKIANGEPRSSACLWNKMLQYLLAE